MKRFLAWHPNGQENSLSYVQAVDLYNNMARMSSRQRIRERSLKELLGYQIWKETPNVREEYRVWLQAVADRIRNIHEVEDVLVQLEKGGRISADTAVWIASVRSCTVCLSFAAGMTEFTGR